MKKTVNKLFTIALSALLIVNTIPSTVYAEEEETEIKEEIVETIQTEQEEQKQEETIVIEEAPAAEEKKEETKQEEFKQEAQNEEKAPVENEAKEEKKEELKNEESIVIEVEAPVLETSSVAAMNTIAEAVEEAAPKKEQIKVTLHFEGILNTNGTTKESSQSSTLSAKLSSWTVGVAKFNNMIANSKKVTIGDVIYEFSGEWADSNGNKIEAPLTFKYEDFTDDTTISVHPVYTEKKAAHIEMNLVDNISTGSSRATNINTFSSYSKTFKTPSARSHYRFLHWEELETGRRFVNGDKYTITAEEVGYGNTKQIYVYAMWQPSVTISYHKENGTTIKNEEVFEDYELYKYNPGDKQGMKFEGWSDQINGEIISTDKIYPTLAPTYEKVDQTIHHVYAVYSVSYNVEHYVEGLDGNYTLKETETVSGAKIGSSAKATVKEYKGFEVNASSSTLEDVAKSGLTLKVYYSRKNYKVSYRIENAPADVVGVPSDKTYKYGQSVQIAGPASAKGHTFNGWDTDHIDMIDDDVVITGSFNVNKHNVSYSYENAPENAPALPETKEYAFGSDVIIAKAPELKGYTFSGWDHENFTMDDQSVMIKGSWKVNQYKVSYEYTGNVPENAPELPEEASYDYLKNVTVAQSPKMEGYTFSGWDHKDFTMDDKDVVIKGYWTINSHTVSYEYEGEIPAGAPKAPEAKDYEFNADVVIEKAPQMKGYTFSGWDKENFKMIDGNVVIKGSWTINKHNVSYEYENAPENAPAAPEAKEYEFNAEVKVEDAPKMEGYTFSGWDHENFTMDDEDVVIKGSWTINSHEVRYEYEGDVPAKAPKAPKAETYKYQDEVKIIEIENIEGYTFSGWDHKDFNMIDEDVVIKGHWTINSHKVSYRYAEGSPANAPALPEDKDYKYNDEVKVAGSPKMEGYTFQGWDHKDFQLGDADEIITGSWTINSHKVSYEYDNAPKDAPKAPETKEYDYNAKVMIEEAPTMKGYTFSGWDKEDFDMIDNDVVIRGSWTINTHKVSYEFDGEVPQNAPELPKEEKYEYLSDVKVADSLKMEGYTFSGWDHENFTMDDEDVVIKGSWTINSHEVRYEYEGEVPENAPELPKEEKYEYLSDVKVADSLKMEGYTFSGWDHEDFNMIDEDVVIKGHWTINSHEVRYEYEGEVPENAPELPEGKTFEYNALVSIENAPELEGYTFSGWDHEDFSMIDEDVVIKGSFEINRYTVTWVNENGTVLETDEEVEYGTMPTFDSTTPIKAADSAYTYTFKGWTPELETVKGDVTYTAVFNAVSIPETVTEDTPEGPKPSAPTPTNPVSNPEEPEIETAEALIPEVETAEVTIKEDAIPMAYVEENEKSWALFNLIASIITILTALGMIISFFNKKEENEEEEEENKEYKRNHNKFLGMIPAILSVIVFILTEDMRNPMVWKDRYTIIMVIIAVFNLLMAYLTRNKEEEKEEKEEELVQA